MATKTKKKAKNDRGRSIQTVKPSKLLLGANRRVQGINSDVDDITLNGGRFRARIGEAVIGDPRIERSIELASALTIPVLDENGELRRSSLLKNAHRVKLDDLDFSFVGFTRNEDSSLELLYEPLNVHLLRMQTGARKVRRGRWTRAEFLAKLVTEVKRPHRIPFFSPELHTRQPIEKDRQVRQARADSGPTRGRGLDTTARLTVKGEPANSEQLRNGDTVMRVGASLGADSRVLASAIVSGIQENNMTNNDAGSGCRGYFCIIDSTAAGLGFNPLDLAKAAHSYFTNGFGAGTGAIAYAKKNPGASPAEISSAIERNAAGASDRYRWEKEAREWVQAFGGGGIDGSSTALATERYEFERKKGENTWSCGKRLASEVRWRWFESAGIIYYIAEPDLLASEVRMRIGEDADGVEAISYDYNTSRPVTEIRVTARTKDWAAPPGTVAKIVDEGPADGLYIVSSISTGLGDELADITLKTPTKPLPEPAPETRTVSIGGGSREAAARGGSDALQRMIAEAEAIDKKNYPYVYGGGHGSFSGPYDCSGAVSAVLHAGGFLSSPLDTVGLASWGESGEGREVTVLVRNGQGGSIDHTIMKLGRRGWFGTSGSNPGGGAGFFSPSSSYLAGFAIKRHPRGL